ncbi:hypothetical protein RhiJN_26792 [Ceratobasidium sp. AG-Ba]|nr:hypothetical protein RhiJN_12741 [Ceratobasidium sp. AG-Ba]QRV98773.1 hypothetical protein RhiJN_26792 [Ceratobasidium sp. AG-Ba]
MTVLMGTAAGGLTAAAVYYGFSRLFETRTNALKRDLKTLSNELSHPAVSGPLPAAARIHRSPFREMVQQRWNTEIEEAVINAHRFDWSQQWDHLKRRVASIMG